MGPKKNPEADPTSVNALDIMLAVKSSVESLNVKVDSIQASLNLLQTQQVKSEKRIDQLAELINDREQHTRSFSVRISGLSVSEQVAKDSIQTASLVYEKLLKPIIALAVTDGSIPEIPSMWQMIENAHVLPSRSKDPNKPTATCIIVRFQSRLIRSLVFKFKRSYLSSSSDTGIFINDDLTKTNHSRLMELKKRPDVASAWSMNGKLFYTEKADPTNKKRA